MKKLLLIASLIVFGLSGCFFPYRDHDDRDHDQDGDHHEDRDGGHRGNH